MSKMSFKAGWPEIEAHFDFIGSVDHGNTRLTQPVGNTPAYSSQAKDDLLRTFRASAFLLLYNLMESTFTNAVEAIFVDVVSGNVDAELIRGLAEDYGFSRPNVPRVWAKATSRGFLIILSSGSSDSLVKGAHYTP